MRRGCDVHMIHVILWDGDRDVPLRYYDEESFNLANLIRNCNILAYTLDADDICMCPGGLKVILHDVKQA